MSELGEMPSGVKVNEGLVRMLEAALTDARSGKMVAGGVVAVVGHSAFAAFAEMSSFPAEIIAGAEVMKADVIMKMRQPRQSAIVRAGAAQVPRFNG